MLKRTNGKAIFRKYSMIIALAVVFVLFSLITEGRLLYPQNLSNQLLQNASVLVMGCGMLLCILTGGNIDLSVGSTVCLIGAASALLLEAGLNAFLVIVICLVLALMIGAWQGFLIGYIHIPPFICTLAGMFLFRGIARVLLHSNTITISNDTFLDIFASYIHVPGLDDGKVKWSAFLIGIVVAVILVIILIVSRTKKSHRNYKTDSAAASYAFIAVIDLLILYYTWKLSHYKGIPVMAIWVLGVVLLYAFITSKTVIGRSFYAVGGNEKAAKLSGIDTRKVYFMAYASMSLLAGLAGLLVAARIGCVNGDTGNGFEMDAIGACFIGGASAYGGSGKISGIVIGAFLLGVINQGMSIIGLDNNWQYIVKGGVLLVAVVFDVVSNHKTGKS